MDFSKIFIYRITHIENIPHILENGITHRSSPAANPAYKAIGDTSLIDARSHRYVAVNNGQFAAPFKTVLLGDFIPFYFGVRMPMLFVIQQGGNFVPQAVSPEDIVYMACPISSIVERRKEFYFTNCHPTENYASVYDSSFLEHLPQIVDWNAVTARYWGGSENLMLKARKQAEFLVRGDVPPECIAAFACYSQAAKEKLMGMGIDECRIKVYPNAYY